MDKKQHRSTGDSQLTIQKLEIASRLVYEGSKGGIGNISVQLNDFDKIRHKGLIVNPRSDLGFNFQIPVALLDILDCFKSQTSVSVLEKWISSNMADKKNRRLNFIQILVNFSTLIDDGSFFHKDKFYSEIRHTLNKIVLINETKAEIAKRITRTIDQIVIDGDKPLDKNEIDEKMSISAIKSIEGYPFIDAFDMDFEKFISEKTKTLHIKIVPGTYAAGFTKGHVDFISKLENHNRHQEEISKTTQRIILILPITDMSGLPKSEVLTGNTYQRVSTMMLALSNYSRNEILITTTLQPIPREVGDSNERFKRTFSNLCEKITQDLQRSNRKVDFSLEICGGSDELNWTNTGESRRVALDQPPKFTENIPMIVTRHRDARAIIKSHKELEKIGGTVILTPGIKQNSSTLGIKLFVESNDLSTFPECAHQMIRKYWSTEAIETRTKGGMVDPKVEKLLSKKMEVKGEKVPSTTSIYEVLIEDLKTL